MTPVQESGRETHVVWMHRDGQIRAVAALPQDMADAYASYCSRRQPGVYFEVRPEVIA